MNGVAAPAVNGDSKGVAKADAEDSGTGAADTTTTETAEVPGCLSYIVGV